MSVSTSSFAMRKSSANFRATANDVQKRQLSLPARYSAYYLLFLPVRYSAFQTMRRYARADICAGMRIDMRVDMCVGMRVECLCRELAAVLTRLGALCVDMCAERAGRRA